MFSSSNTPKYFTEWTGISLLASVMNLKLRSNFSFFGLNSTSLVFLILRFNLFVQSMMMLMMMMMMMMMNDFCGMVHRRKACSLISSWDHCQRDPHHLLLFYGQLDCILVSFQKQKCFYKNKIP